jgi:hypothetical protein
MPPTRLCNRPQLMCRLATVIAFYFPYRCGKTSVPNYQNLRSQWNAFKKGRAGEGRLSIKNFFTDLLSNR